MISGTLAFVCGALYAAVLTHSLRKPRSGEEFFPVLPGTYDLEEADKEFAAREEECRAHYDQTKPGRTFDEHKAAYLYGWRLRASWTRGSQRWEDVESKARPAWEKENPNHPWTEYVASARFGWDLLDTPEWRVLELKRLKSENQGFPTT